MHSTFDIHKISTFEIHATVALKTVSAPLTFGLNFAIILMLIL